LYDFFAQLGRRNNPLYAQQQQQPQPPYPANAGPDIDPELLRLRQLLMQGAQGGKPAGTKGGKPTDQARIPSNPVAAIEARIEAQRKKQAAAEEEKVRLMKEYAGGLGKGTREAEYTEFLKGEDAREYAPKTGWDLYRAALRLGPIYDRTRRGDPFGGLRDAALAVNKEGKAEFDKGRDRRESRFSTLSGLKGKDREQNAAVAAALYEANRAGAGIPGQQAVWGIEDMGDEHTRNMQQGALDVSRMNAQSNAARTRKEDPFAIIDAYKKRMEGMKQSVTPEQERAMVEAMMKQQKPTLTPADRLKYKDAYMQQFDVTYADQLKSKNPEALRVRDMLERALLDPSGPDPSVAMQDAMKLIPLKSK
jgi:hypothetical protein